MPFTGQAQIGGEAGLALFAGLFGAAAGAESSVLPDAGKLQGLLDKLTAMADGDLASSEQSKLNAFIKELKQLVAQTSEWDVQAATSQQEPLDTELLTELSQQLADAEQSLEASDEQALPVDFLRQLESVVAMTQRLHPETSATTATPPLPELAEVADQAGVLAAESESEADIEALQATMARQQDSDEVAIPSPQPAMTDKAKSVAATAAASQPASTTLSNAEETALVSKAPAAQQSDTAAEPLNAHATQTSSEVLPEQEAQPKEERLPQPQQSSQAAPTTSPSNPPAGEVPSDLNGDVGTTASSKPRQRTEASTATEAVSTAPNVPAIDAQHQITPASQAAESEAVVVVNTDKQAERAVSVSAAASATKGTPSMVDRDEPVLGESSDVVESNGDESPAEKEKAAVEQPASRHRGAEFHLLTRAFNQTRHDAFVPTAAQQDPFTNPVLSPSHTAAQSLSASSLDSMNQPSLLQNAAQMTPQLRAMLADPTQASAHLKANLLLMVNKGLEKATIQLDPPELGSMMIKLQVNHDQQAQVQFTVANPQAREMLENAMPRLRDMLNEAGIELDDAQISQQDRQSEERRESWAGNGRERVETEQLFGQDVTDAEQRVISLALSPGRVDYFA